MTATLSRPRPKAKLSSTIQWNPIPIEGRWDTGAYHKWTSRCGGFLCYRTLDWHGEAKYASVIVESFEGRDTQWFVEVDPIYRGGYPRYFQSLDGALESVERYIARHGVVVLSSNRDKVVEAATRLSLEGYTPPEKKKASPKTTENKTQKPRLGVIETIVQCLQRASKKRPISRAGILSVLIDAFPERDPKSMKFTVDIQVPKRLKLNGWLVKGNEDKGFWMDQREKETIQD